MSSESIFQSRLIDRIKTELPGSIILKNDPLNFNGIPDLTIFFGNRYALLECKRDAKAHRQPNQTYFVNKFNEMSFSAFICPENESDILESMYTYLKGG